MKLEWEKMWTKVWLMGAWEGGDGLGVRRAVQLNWRRMAGGMGYDYMHRTPIKWM